MMEGSANRLRREDIEAALVRAAARARRIAAETGTPLVFVRDGRIVEEVVTRDDPASRSAERQGPAATGE